MRERSFGVAVDTLITSDTVITTLTDTLVYEDGSSTTNWNVSGGSTTVSSIGGEINVSSSAATFLWGTSRYFTTQAGVTYTVNFYLDMGTCSGSAIRSEIIDNTFTSSVYGTYTTSGHKSYTFTATGAGFGGITFVMNYPGAACGFNLDSVVITYDSTVTTVNHDTIYRDRIAYRYAFNGKEKDDEVKGLGDQYDYGFRFYDSRLGKFLSIDPLAKDYPYYSTYQFAGNKPIWKIDLDGMEENAPFAAIGTIRISSTPNGKARVNWGVGVQVGLTPVSAVNLNVNNFQQNNKIMVNGYASTTLLGGVSAGVSYTPSNGQVKLFGGMQGTATFEQPDPANMNPGSGLPLGITTEEPVKNAQEFTEKANEDCQEDCENVSINGPEEANVTTEDGKLKINSDNPPTEKETAEKTADQLNQGVQNSGYGASNQGSGPGPNGAGNGTGNNPQNTQQTNGGNTNTLPKNYEEFKRAFLSMPVQTGPQTPKR